MSLMASALASASTKMETAVEVKGEAVEAVKEGVVTGSNLSKLVDKCLSPCKHMDSMTKGTRH